MLFTRHDDDHVIGELWDTLLCVLLERLEDVHLAARERAARFVTPPHPTRVWGCHKPVSLGVVLVVLYHLGVVLVGTMHMWERSTRAQATLSLRCMAIEIQPRHNRLTKLQ
jgi:hypothetical protein